MPASHLAIYNDLRGPEQLADPPRGGGQRGHGRGLPDHPPRQRRRHAGRRHRHAAALHEDRPLPSSKRNWPAATASRPASAAPSTATAPAWCLGEGAGAVMLEELGQAQARGATIYGEVLAAASSAVAVGSWWPAASRPSPTCCRPCCARAGATPDEIGHMHAHGLSTRTCDAEEARAIHGVFGGRAGRAGRGRQELFRQLGGRRRHGRVDRQPAGLAARPALPDAQLRDARCGLPRGGGA